jgi:hypothetical protein
LYCQLAVFSVLDLKYASIWCPLFNSEAGMFNNSEHSLTSLYRKYGKYLERCSSDLFDLETGESRQMAYGLVAEKVDMSAMLAYVKKIPVLAPQPSRPAVRIAGSDNQDSAGAEDAAAFFQQFRRLVQVLDHFEQRYCIE